MMMPMCFFSYEYGQSLILNYVGAYTGHSGHCYSHVTSLTHCTSLGDDLVIALDNVLCLNVYKLACVQGRTRVGPIDN